MEQPMNETKPDGAASWLSDVLAVDEQETYCRQCGNEDLAYIAQYADSKEYKCRECGSLVTANAIAQGREHSERPAGAEG